MNTPGLLKCAGVLVALAIVSACGSSSTVAPSAATVNAATYVGRTLFLNGSPVTAARLNPLPRYAELVPDKSSSKDYEYIFNYYDTYASIFDYPKSIAQIGQIKGAGGQACTNVLYGYGKKIFGTPGASTTRLTNTEFPKN